jgi:glutamate-1-semialdehyde aminotransferase
VVPDLATFSKGIANGYPLSVVVGKREIMEMVKETHLSATFNPEATAIVAAIKTIEILRRPGSIKYIWDMGKRLMDGLDGIGRDMGLEAYSVGLPPIPHFVIKHKDEEKWLILKNTFYRETTAKGILFHPDHHWFISLSHSKEDIDKTLELSREALKKAKKLALGG